MTASTVRPTVAVWFEIPAVDFDRAVGFYEQVFSVALERETVDGHALAVFPYTRPGISGAIVPQTAQFAPGAGPTIFLNADGRLDEMVARVTALGGALETPVTPLPENLGTYAVIRDTEGNRVGLHAIS